MTRTALGMFLVAHLSACGEGRDAPADASGAADAGGPAVPSFAGRLEGSGPLRAAAGGRVITPTEYETFRDCGEDARCPGDPGYPGADAGEGDGEYDRGEELVDCGVDRLCPGDPGYPGPDRGEADGEFQAVFLAGFQGAFGQTHGGRPMQGVHDDIWVRALYVEQGPARLVVLAFDTVGLMPKYTNALKRRLRDELGVPPAGVIVAALHNHEAPDSMGLWSTNGVDPRFMLPAVDAAVELVAELAAHAVPVAVRAAVGEPDGCLDGSGEPVPASLCRDPTHEDGPGDVPLLATDTRDPYVRDLVVPAARFEREDGTAVATLLGVANHAETLADENPLATADYPGWARERLAATGGGEVVLVVGAVGGMMTPLRGTAVPLRGEDGERVRDADGRLAVVGAASFAKARSLGYEVADAADEALARAPLALEPRLVVQTVDLDLPLDVTYRLVLDLTQYLDPADRRLFDGEGCGPGGCLRTDLTRVTLGELSILTAPGELLPELWLGRDGVIVPYPGLPAYPFPALAGIRSAMPTAVPMLVGLANVELGYLIPESDVLGEGNPFLGQLPPEDHPNYYEESVSPGPAVGRLYCDAALALLHARRDCAGAPVD